MSDTADPVRGHAVVVQPGEGPSYWQPVPANGHADPGPGGATAGAGDAQGGEARGGDAGLFLGLQLPVFDGDGEIGTREGSARLGQKPGQFARQQLSLPVIARDHCGQECLAPDA